MNAADSTLTVAPRPVTPIHPTHKFKLLLKREYWEHKGGFLWAPIIAGGISLFLTLMGIVVGLLAARRAVNEGKLELDGVSINGLDLGQLTGQMTHDNMVKLGQGMDLTLVLSSAWPFIVLGFVVFFYCLGALYDDRKDRSVLFWKSLPVSDTQTVLSKVVSAIVVAPVIACAVAIITMFVFLLMISVVVLAHGGNPVTLLWGPANPTLLALSCIAWIPVYALWALPTVGWLLMVSAWARSKPFLWAVIVPLFAGIVVSWLDLMNVFQIQANWFWSNVVGRLLLGLVPGIDTAYREGLTDGAGPSDLQGVIDYISPAYQLGVLTMPDVWIGAIAGAVMIYIAIRLRRWRDDG